MRIITVYDITELAQLVAELTRQGLTFEAKPDGAAWTIEIKGY